MTSFGKLSRPAKIARLFGEQATELQFRSLALTLDLTATDLRAAMPGAKDILKAEYGLRLTPIIEREGWWTSDPTHRIAIIALKASIERHHGEWQRNSRIYDGFGLAEEAAAAGRLGARGTDATIEDIIEKEVAVSPEHDYVLARVDEAVAAGKGYVERSPKAVAA